jgi:hypothetical protein
VYYNLFCLATIQICNTCGLISCAQSMKAICRSISAWPRSGLFGFGLVLLLQALDLTPLLLDLGLLRSKLRLSLPLLALGIRHFIAGGETADAAECATDCGSSSWGSNSCANYCSCGCSEAAASRVPCSRVVSGFPEHPTSVTAASIAKTKATPCFNVVFIAVPSLS